MTRFTKELRGELGAYWKADAEKRLEEMSAAVAKDEITIDDNGIERRWYYGKDRIMEDVKAGKVWAKLINNNIDFKAFRFIRQEYEREGVV